MAGSAPRTPKDDIKAGAQQPVQDENAPMKGDRRSELTYEQNLYQCRQPIPIILSGGECIFGDVFMDFRNLSQMSILHLMNELAKHEQATKNNKAAPQDIEHLENLLHRYRNLTWSEEEFRRRGYDGYWEGRTPENISPFVDTLARFIVAITGGLSLIIPMLVMRLGETTLPKSLTTVSVAVILFSALTSLMFKASNVETLGTTAAYAAVLVVFVGTSG